MPKPLLIGIGGYATSGKDTVADILVRDHGFYKTYMSKPLESSLLALDPQLLTDGDLLMRYSQLHSMVGYDQSKKNPEVRRLLQVLGTEVGRNILGTDVWTNLMLKEVQPILAKGQNVVVTGIRFHNERNAIKTASSDGTIESELWWIDRGLPPVNDHASDNSLSMKDFTHGITNTGTISELEATIDAIITHRGEPIKWDVIRGARG